MANDIRRKSVAGKADLIHLDRLLQMSVRVLPVNVTMPARLEKRALVGVEVAVHRNRVFVTGRIGCRAAEDIDIAAIVREIYRSAGYSNSWSPDPDSIEVLTDLCLGPLEQGEAEFRSVSDDQSICTGYATAIAETNYLPVEHWLASRLGRRLSKLREDKPNLHLGPDGKVIVTVVEGEDGCRLEEFSCSVQQKSGADDISLHRTVRETLQEEMGALAAGFPRLSPEVPENLSVNGAGAFEVGGPEGDNGLSGKKLVVDAYGPRIPIGGGALSGKDFFKVDRTGGILARRVAKAVVMTGAAEEALVRIAWFPGDMSGRLLSIEGKGAQALETHTWQALFDLSLEDSGESWTNAADLLEIARFGHFTDKELPWEKLRFSSRALGAAA